MTPKFLAWVSEWKVISLTEDGSQGGVGGLQGGGANASGT